MAPKKKLTKKEKARLEAEQAELARIEMEKEKLRKQEEERERKQREREEAEKRQQQEIYENGIRRQQLKLSMEYFDRIAKKMAEIKIERHREIEWNEYMRCDGLPNPRNPGDLRKHIHMWNVAVREEKHCERNWLLRTDERTLLTQDSAVADLSRKNLRKKQGNLGDIYSNRIREILGILNEMGRALKENTLPPTTLIDLQRLITEIRTQLHDFIDGFTCRILSHIDRDLEPLKPGIMKHDYISDVFKSQILAMQSNVQAQKDIKFRVDEPRHTEIEFPLLELTLSLPPAVKIQNSAIRGLWLNYDHFSDYCPSFNMPQIKKSDLNILQQTKKEWKKRKEIILSTLEDTVKPTPDSDKLLFDSNEPPEPRTVDVDKIYAEYEDELNKARRRGLESLNLSEVDINLRKYRIVGGVYCIDYLEQPTQDKKISSKTFVRTIISPDKLTMKKFRQSYKPPPPPLPGVRRLPEEIEFEMRTMERNLDKLAQVSLQLPPTVLWFEPPVVCRWETVLETVESENEISTSSHKSDSITSIAIDTSQRASFQMSSPRKSIQSLVAAAANSPRRKSSSPRKSIADSRKQSTKSLIRTSFMVGTGSMAAAADEEELDNGISFDHLPVKEINDFDMFNLPASIDLYNLVIDFIIPRLPEGYCIQLQCTAASELFAPKPIKTYLFLARHETTKSGGTAKTNSKHDELFRRNYCKSIGKFLIKTNSPRSFYSRMKIKKILQIKLAAAEEEEEGNMGVSKQKAKEKKKKKKYMLSQLLEDLDEIFEMQMPFSGDPKLYEIRSKSSSSSASLSSPPIATDHRSQIAAAGDDSDDSDDSAAEKEKFAGTAKRKFSGIIILKESDLEHMNKILKSSKTAANSEDLESYSEFDDIEEMLSEDEMDDEEMADDEEDDEDEQEEEAQKLNTKKKSKPLQGKWSTRDVHDAKFNEDKLCIQFRTGRLGFYGFASNRYSNMPYQTWELKPQANSQNAVFFNLTAAVVSIEMVITEKGFCLNSIQGGTTDEINNKLIGKTVALEILRSTLQDSAVDIFPELDAFCYSEGSCEKNFTMEMHLYNCMSSLAESHNFTWSRWNLLSGSRVAVLLMREILENRKIPNHSTLYVTPLKATIVDCTEVSASFTTAGIQGMDYYADLHQLIQVHGNAESRLKQDNMDPVLRDNIAQILIQTRPLSFC